ncbi:MAG: hypothetical protein ACKVQV_13985 [Bacteroidia bacterium]
MNKHSTLTTNPITVDCNPWLTMNKQSTQTTNPITVDCNPPLQKFNYIEGYPITITKIFCDGCGMIKKIYSYIKKPELTGSGSGNK